jgi:hypothetical protein
MIIAKAVMFPGSNTLLMNLLTSFADDDDDDDNAEEAEKEARRSARRGPAACALAAGRSRGADRA